MGVAVLRRALLESGVVEFIDEVLRPTPEGLVAERACLVCCLQGKSRSVSIVLGYLLIARQMPLMEGLKLIREKRPQAAPNLGFIAGLKRLEKELNSEAEVSLAALETADALTSAA